MSVNPKCWFQLPSGTREGYRRWRPWNNSIELGPDRVKVQPRQDLFPCEGGLTPADVFSDDVAPPKEPTEKERARGQRVDIPVQPFSMDLPVWDSSDNLLTLRAEVVHPSSKMIRLRLLQEPLRLLLEPESGAEKGCWEIPIASMSSEPSLELGEYRLRMHAKDYRPLLDKIHPEGM